MQGRLFTVANGVTVLRVPMVIGAVIALAHGYPRAAAMLLVAAFMSDAIDGTIARATGTTSEWGRLLDPLADKIAFAIIAVSLAWIGRIPWWIVAAIVGRDLLVGVGGILLRGYGELRSSSVLGKLSSFALAIYLFKQAFWPGALLVAGVDVLGVVAIVLLLASTVGYVAVYWRTVKTKPIAGSEKRGKVAVASVGATHSPSGVPA